MFFSIKEVEEIFGLAHASVYRLIKAGRLEVSHIGKKTVVPAVSVARLIVELERCEPVVLRRPTRADSQTITPAPAETEGRAALPPLPPKRLTRLRS